MNTAAVVHRCSLRDHDCAHKLATNLPKRNSQNNQRLLIDLATDQYAGNGVDYVGTTLPSTVSSGQYVIFSSKQHYQPPATSWHRQRADDDRYWEDTSKCTALRVLRVQFQSGPELVYASFLEVTQRSPTLGGERTGKRTKMDNDTNDGEISQLLRQLLEEIRVVNSKITTLSERLETVEKSIQELRVPYTPPAAAARVDPNRESWHMDFDQKLDEVFHI